MAIKSQFNLLWGLLVRSSIVFLPAFNDGLAERNGENAQDFAKDITLTVKDLTDSNDPSNLYQYTDGMKHRDS